MNVLGFLQDGDVIILLPSSCCHLHVAIFMLPSSCCHLHDFASIETNLFASSETELISLNTEKGKGMLNFPWNWKLLAFLKHLNVCNYWIPNRTGIIEVWFKPKLVSVCEGLMVCSINFYLHLSGNV